MQAKQISLFSFALRELGTELVTADNITDHRMSLFLRSEISSVNQHQAHSAKGSLPIKL